MVPSPFLLVKKVNSQNHPFSKLIELSLKRNDSINLYLNINFLIEIVIFYHLIMSKNSYSS
jgi:hypothetical protein